MVFLSKGEPKEERPDDKGKEDLDAPAAALATSADAVPEVESEYLPARKVALKVPDGVSEGQALSFKGPDGRMLQAVVPKGKQTGDEFEAVLPAAILLTVPAGGKAGDRLHFAGPDGVRMQASVPEGKSAGDKFEAHFAPAPPAQATLTVPEGIEEGKEISFVAPGGARMNAVVPPGKKPGDTFVVQLAPPQTVPWKVKVPENGKPGDTVTFAVGNTGQHMTVNVPQPKGEEEPLKPGDTFVVNLPAQIPQGRTQSMTVVVPEGFKPGDTVSFKGSDGNPIWTHIPPGLKEGDKFNVNFQVRNGPQSAEQVRLGHLCNAASGDDLEVVKKWLNEGVPVDGEYELGFTALIYASMNGRTEIVKHLLAEKADVAAKTHDVRTPLHFACRNGHTETAKVLLDAKAPIDVKDVLGRTPLKTAEEKGQTETFEALKAAGVKE